MSSYFDDASLVMIPSGYKTSKVYSVKPTDGSGDLTFSRSNDTATRVNSAGLIEKVRTNLILQSQDFSTTWSANSCSVSTNTTANPLDGAVNADTITFTGGTTQKYVIQAFAFNGVYTVSAFLKAGTNQFVQFLLGSDAGIYVNFDLVNGIRSGAFGSTANMVSLGNGWYRCSMAFTSTAGTHVFIQAVDSLAANRFDATTSTGTLIAFGYQVETGDIATDYIATTSAAVSVGPVANVPRLDYLNSSCPRLLLEPQRVNIFPKSESSDTWSFTNMTRTGNHGIAPDGYQSADLLAPTTSGVVTFTSDSTTSSLTIGQPFVCSFFIKLNQSFNSNAGQNIIDLRLGGSALWARPTVRINLVTGSVTEIQNASYLSSTNYGNGWFRITFGAIPTGTTNATQLQTPTGTTMDGGSFYIWGLQGEANATYATSYIPTLGAAVTRGNDFASKSSINALIGGTSGTIFFEIKTNKTLTSTNYKQFFYYTDASGAQAYMYLNSSNTLVLNPSLGTISSSINLAADTVYKVAVAYATNDFKLYINGVERGSSTSGTSINAVNLLSLGSYQGTSEFNEFVFLQYIHFPTRLSNSDLAALTA